MDEPKHILTLSPEDLETLTEAKKDLENIGVIMQGVNSLGGVIDSGTKFIPKKQQVWFQKKISGLLAKIVSVNLSTMEEGQAFKEPSEKTYKAIATGSGMLGGFFGSTTGIGTLAFVADLSFATNVMMRSIMDIARSEGEDLYNLETQLNCIQVFAMGGNSKDDDSMDTIYYGGRVALDNAVKAAGSYLAKNGIQGLNKLLVNSANPLMKLLSMITSRFTVQVSEKFMAQAVPIAGAAAGGAINLLFINHFQKVAKAHFAIRRLERRYGKDLVKNLYLEINIDEN
jgi:hypothetical protein